MIDICKQNSIQTKQGNQRNQRNQSKDMANPVNNSWSLSSGLPPSVFNTPQFGAGFGAINTNPPAQTNAFSGFGTIGAKPAPIPSSFPTMFGNANTNTTNPTNTNTTNPTPTTNTTNTTNTTISPEKHNIINCLTESKYIQSQILDQLKTMTVVFQQNQHTMANKSFTPPTTSLIIHNGIHCDMCKKQNIQGIRYKCVFCNDFDLCEECEAKDMHNFDHSFIKIKNTEHFNNRVNNRIY